LTTLVVLTPPALLHPEFRFLQPLYHPNIYTDGRLCISILHAPGEDALSGESAAERWSPAQRVESVLISILSLLDDAECSSPANVDAAVMFRTNHDQYCAIVKSQVEKSKTNMPPDFVMPVSETVTAVPEVEKEEPDFWADSDVDSDVFGGSDSDEDLDMDQSSPSDEDDDDEQQDMDEE
jgi:ubiquitin-conjugating enzyme E2 R